MLDRLAVAIVALLGLFTVVPGLAYAQPAHDFDEAVRRALELLPRQPGHIVIVDVTETTALLRDHLQHVDAFVTTGDKTVYLKKQGQSLQYAVKGPRFYDYVLAGTIWHEMAHIEGRDERGARLAEQQLWRTFMLRGQVEMEAATRYLGLLAKQAPH